MANKFEVGDIVTWDPAEWAYKSVRNPGSFILANIGKGPFVFRGINEFGHCLIEPLHKGTTLWDPDKTGYYTTSSNVLIHDVFLNAARRAIECSK